MHTYTMVQHHTGSRQRHGIFRGTMERSSTSDGAHLTGGTAMPVISRLRTLPRNIWMRSLVGVDWLTPVRSRRRSLPSRESQRPHWVLCFYGVERSLAYTATSIHRRILRPLDRAGVSVTVIAHFNRVPRIIGSYSREDHVDLSRDRVRLLDPDMLWIEPQSDSSIHVEAEAIRSVPWRLTGLVPALHDQYAEAGTRLLHQLHSLSQAYALMQLAGLRRMDVVAALRADIRYLDDLDVEHIAAQISQDKADLVTPSWQKRGGLNDRFSFIAPSAVGPVLERRHEVAAFVAERGYIHAEELMDFAVRRAGLRLAYTPMRGERVRATGRPEREDFESDEGWVMPSSQAALGSA